MKQMGILLILAIISLTGSFIPVRAEVSKDARLKAGEIRKTLVGKVISYNPPGWADTAISEEFHPDGTWRGTLYGRGPIAFSGHWEIVNDRMCVTADEGNIANRWHPGLYCREVRRDQKSGNVQTEYLGDQPTSPNKFGLQNLTVFDLTAIKTGL